MSALADDRVLERARALLARAGAWIDAAPAGGYHLRTAADRRRRPALVLDEAVLRELTASPGLRPRAAGGWIGRPAPARTAAPPGRPGRVDEARVVTEPDGRPATRTVNLGESPLAWLLRRGALTPLQAAAGARLREDVHLAGVLGRLTMSWEAGPRASAGRGPGAEPAERAWAAKARVRGALEAAGPGLREMLEAVCARDLALEAAERALALPRRSGKAVLRLALDRLAAHYRLG